MDISHSSTEVKKSTVLVYKIICFSGSKLFQYGDSSNELPLDEEFPHDPNIVWKVRQGEDRFDLYKEGVSLIFVAALP